MLIAGRTTPVVMALRIVGNEPREFVGDPSAWRRKLSNVYQFMTPSYIPANCPQLSSRPTVIFTALIERTTAHGFRTYYMSRG